MGEERPSGEVRMTGETESRKIGALSDDAATERDRLGQRVTVITRQLQHTQHRAAVLEAERDAAVARAERAEATAANRRILLEQAEGDRAKFREVLRKLHTIASGADLFPPALSSNVRALAIIESALAATDHLASPGATNKEDG